MMHTRHHIGFLSANPSRLLSLLLPILVLFCSSSSGLESRSGTEIYISEKIEDDLLAGGSDIKFDGEIRGDIIAAGMDIVIDGIVDGNINAVGYTVKAGGIVYRSVRLAGYKVTADGRVGGNLVLVGVVARVSSTCEVQNDVNISSPVVYVNGTIAGDLDVDGDEVVISGTINGNVKIIASKKLTIERTAAIFGNLDYTAPEKAKIADDAQIDGDVKRTKKSDKDENGLGSILWALVHFVGAFATGLIVVAFCRKQSCSIKDAVSLQLPRSLGYGLVVFVVVPVVILLTAVTVLGLPVAGTALLTYVVLFYISKLFVAMALGERALKLVSPSGQKSYALSLLIGLLILTGLFRIPFAGTVIYLATVMTGLGAMLIAYNQLRASRSNPS
jgi:cytoskeletal protein CcmA (bactofilin family)